MKAVLLAGGLGTRMREETEFRPKPMVEVGGQPIIWHIMRNLAHFGITDFIITSGYMSHVIDEYFRSHEGWTQIPDDRGDALVFQGSGDEADWTVRLVFTGDTTGTGGRVFRARPYLDDEPFFVTYGDGLADVDIAALLDFHGQSSSLATLTAVQPTSRFGLMDIDEDGRVTHFREKPKMEDWVSIGFFIFEPAVLDYLNEDCGLEEEGLAPLAAHGELNAFRHDGFWQPMDTYREYLILTNLWESGEPPWRRW